MSLLTCVQHFCRRTGVQVPATVLGTTDPQVAQIYALLEEEGHDLAQRGPWQGLTQEAAHTTLAAEDQGAIDSIASGFRSIKNETIWDRTDGLPVYGPLDSKYWQGLKATVTTTPRYQYRIRGGRLIVSPAPPAGHDWRFEYLSKYWVMGADGTTKQYVTLDTDTFLLPEELLLMGLRWRWKKEKGLDYAEDFRTYEMQVKDAIGRDGGKPTLHLDGSESGKPGVFVPAGSWLQP